MYQSEETDSGHATGEVAELFHCLTWTGPGVVEGEFGTPVDLAVDSRGCTYVLDHAKARVQEFDSAGGFVLQWGASGIEMGNREPQLPLIHPSFPVPCVV